VVALGSLLHPETDLVDRVRVGMRSVRTARRHVRLFASRGITEIATGKLAPSAVGRNGGGERVRVGGELHGVVAL